MVAVLEGAGLVDVQDMSPYDPSVTYRATQGGAIVELIWGMKNHRAFVDELWLARSEETDIDGLRLSLTAPEEMIWPKLYVLSRERSDWPDVLNLLYFCGVGLDWGHLVNRLRDDSLLLAGALCVLRWLSPDRVREFPSWVVRHLGLEHASDAEPSNALRQRAGLLSAKDWFGPPLEEEAAAPIEPASGD
jgi:hypothetical protein